LDLGGRSDGSLPLKNSRGCKVAVFDSNNFHIFQKYLPSLFLRSRALAYFRNLILRATPLQ